MRITNITSSFFIFNPVILFKKIFYWHIVALQCYISVSTVQQVNQLYIYILIYSLFFWISFPFRSPQSIE